MKKKLLIASVIAMLLPCMTGCNNKSERNDLKTFTYTYFGDDHHHTYKFDFDSNDYTFFISSYFTTDKNKNLKEEGILDSYNLHFTNKEKEEFLDDFASSGISNLEATYGDSSYELDWSLEIEYADRQKFTSKSYGASLDDKSKKVFRKLNKYFKEFVGEELFNSNSKTYVNRRDCKPEIYEMYGNNLIAHFPFEEANYVWNGKTKNDADIYELNLKHKINPYIDDYTYYIKTNINYFTTYDKPALNIDSVVITSYDFCKELTNKKIEEVPDTPIRRVKLKPNKIYTIDYIYGKSNHYEYTFNTFTNNRKVPLGRYFASSDCPFGYLDIKEDNTFTYHFNNGSYDGTTVAVDYDVNGTYEFKTFGDKEKLVLNMDDDSVIVYELQREFLYADVENTTYTKHSSVTKNREFGFWNWSYTGAVCFMPTSLL